MTYHLAELNIGHLRAPLEDSAMKKFSDFLDPVNKLAGDSSGFVWRFTDDQGTPDLFEAKKRLAYLESNGPSPCAFDFTREFERPSIAP